MYDNILLLLFSPSPEICDSQHSRSPFRSLHSQANVLAKLPTRKGTYRSCYACVVSFHASCRRVALFKRRALNQLTLDVNNTCIAEIAFTCFV
jgi:hypothetical protein